jgi:peptidyl-prolyl cis-trans isomerase C
MTFIHCTLKAIVLGFFFVSASVTSWASSDDPVVATVNGVKIHRSMLIAAQKLLPQQYQKIPLEQIFPALVDSVVDMKLAAADARAQKVHETEDFKKRMARIEDQMLQRTVLQGKIEAAVTEEAVRDSFEKMLRSSKASFEVRARHILLKTEDEANQIIRELADGASFETTAKEKSTGPSGPKGGDLGFFAEGQMVPAFEKAAFAVDNGEITKRPVKTQFGWHIIKVEDRRQSEPPIFDSVKDKLRSELTQKVGGIYVEKLRKAAKIKRFDLDGSPLTK